jgi:hypothetical protein
VSGDAFQAKARRDRRAWISEHHPDHGGDPNLFAEGLRLRDDLQSDNPPPPTIRRSRSISRTFAKWRRRTGKRLRANRRKSGRVR